MSKLIILSGSGNSGKSESLIKLANKIGISSSHQYPFPKDFQAICKKGNKTVAIFAQLVIRMLSQLQTWPISITISVMYIYLQPEQREQLLTS